MNLFSMIMGKGSLIDFQVVICSFFKRSLRAKQTIFSYENKFDLQKKKKNEGAGKIHFHKNGFVRRFVLKLRQKKTRKSCSSLLVYRSFSRDVTASIVVYQNKETATNSFSGM